MEVFIYKGDSQKHKKELQEKEYGEYTVAEMLLVDMINMAYSFLSLYLGLG